MNSGITSALLAAALFGASTPFAKALMGERTPPLLMAGMLYFGSGIGLSCWIAMRAIMLPRGRETASIPMGDAPWLAGAVLAGGVLGPVLLMTGLSMVPAASASLLLNMEGVLTAVLAWFVFRESFDKRVFLGMVLIVAAGMLLSWDSEGSSSGVSWGAVSIVAACFCWAVDNNLTRKVSASDAVQIAAIKGLVAGIVNLTAALVWLDMPLPDIRHIAAAGAIGFAGYGLSLVLFVLALRHLGTARTGAYFSAAPFVGAAISLLLLDESVNLLFWFAAGLMLTGIWLHLTERHVHTHAHEALSHTHAHRHDEHHQHSHVFAWDGKEPHTHAHEHQPLTHTHAHFPDIHHRHRHSHSPDQ